MKPKIQTILIEGMTIILSIDQKYEDDFDDLSSIAYRIIKPYITQYLILIVTQMVNSDEQHHALNINDQLIQKCLVKPLLPVSFDQLPEFREWKLNYLMKQNQELLEVQKAQQAKKAQQTDQNKTQQKFRN
jgi:hypothetical protein